jgi:hypothetical protein
VSYTITQLLLKIGDDNIRFQNLMHDIAGCQLVHKGKESRVTFHTDPTALNPGHLMDPAKAPYVVLVLWLPRELADKAKAELDAEGGAH